jgi:hypothetical protein
VADAVGVGTTTLTFHGDADDTLPVSVAPIGGFTLSDPADLTFRLAEGAKGATLLSGELPEPPGADLRIVAGRKLTLWTRLVGVDGEPLGYDADSLTLPRSMGMPRVAPRLVRNELSLPAVDADLTLTYAGADVPGTIVVRPVEADAITSLDLVVADPGELQGEFDVDLAVLAVARDADGHRVWQPPVRWTIPEGFHRVHEDEELVGPDYLRQDVLFLAWDGENGAFTHTFSARVGDVAADASVDWVAAAEPGPDPPAEDAPRDDTRHGSTCCGSGGAALVALGWFAARPRRRRQRSQRASQLAIVPVTPSGSVNSTK